VAPVRRKRRAHFNDFMTDVHDRIARHRVLRKEGKVKEDDPIPAVARDLAEQAWVLCFDEFTVTDIADAMILSRLFSALFAEGVVLVATSNVAPENLYKDGLNRQLFLPFVDILERRVSVMSLDSETDYRLAKVDRIPVYLTPLSHETDKLMDAAWAKTVNGAPVVPEEIGLKGRMIEVPRAAGRMARFDFADLCEKPVAAREYLAIADRYDTIFIDHVPMLDPTKRNATKRFILLIDTFYDKRLRVFISAEAPPDKLYAGRPGTTEAFEFDRTVSRLIDAIEGLAGRNRQQGPPVGSNAGMTLEVPATQARVAGEPLSRSLGWVALLRLPAGLYSSSHPPLGRLASDGGRAGIRLGRRRSVPGHLKLSVFHLLSAEYDKTGRINIAWFYIRRLLRIYPLMMLFPLAMLLIFGATDRFGWLRLAGLGLFLDNIVSWFRGYNSIRFSNHLWTLSYEFQFYLFLPIVFLVYNRLGQRAFWSPHPPSSYIAFWCACFLFWRRPASDHLVHTVPETESLLAGMCLVVLRPAWKWWWSALVAVLGVILFANLPLPWESAWSSAISYPVIGLTCGAILDVSLRSNMLSKALSIRPLVVLGRISFGLYVYHLLAIHLSIGIDKPPRPQSRSDQQSLGLCRGVRYCVRHHDCVRHGQLLADRTLVR
jgi:cell division protein ZapE